jgi:hypothetical protein
LSPSDGGNGGNAGDKYQRRCGSPPIRFAGAIPALRDYRILDRKAAFPPAL